MKVYVALVGYYFEGYESPIGVFSTRKAAEKACRKEEEFYGTNYYLNVEEYEVDGAAGETFNLKE